MSSDHLQWFMPWCYSEHKSAVAANNANGANKAFVFKPLRALRNSRPKFVFVPGDYFASGIRQRTLSGLIETAALACQMRR